MITVEEVKKLAKLSRIEVSDKEIPKLQKDLSNILDYVSQLKEVDVSNLQPQTSNFQGANVMRADDNPHAPEKGGDYFKVKKVIDYDA